MLDDVYLWVSGRASLARVVRRKDRDLPPLGTGPTLTTTSNPSTSSLGTNTSGSGGTSGGVTGGGAGGSLGAGSDDKKRPVLKGDI